ncbi:hypothetical protein XI09_16180 [Bradyrhizobium sp. CCBAU 11386]|uniref:hypothetical protein n=1 Tax=Bradyrhizobium sp. CCBAU 11386 TaxID=1630837 RepID=UPI002304A7B9|nr:hypothetical protein [Bradyrhizobium sp. CCBAU 11386]MDA9506142.1 hypothetical protein [Bradyrhizobium sp. CCBAU 11386]
MVDNKALESGLNAMAEDFHLPGGGRKKLSQLVAGHMDWFDAAERRGMGWLDMIRALTAAGVTGRGGKPLSVGTLSSTVWRKRAEAEDVKSRASRRARLAPPEPASQHRRLPKEASRFSAGKPPRSERTASRPFDDQAQASRQPPTLSKRSAPEVRSQNRDVLAFMDRARAVRRKSD